MTVLFVLLGAILVVFLVTALTGAPYVPSFRKELRIAFTELYKLSADDYIVDLGSGDGIVLKTAAEFGAGGLGIEINPVLVFISRFRLRKNKNLSIRNENLFKAKFPPQTTVIYVFGENRDILHMAEHIQDEANRLNKTLCLISHGFEVPKLKPAKKHRAYFLYKIEANSSKK